MELHPFLEMDTRPSAGWWYVLTTFGECPSMRVGHVAVHVKGQGQGCVGQDQGQAGKVYFVGGANPSGPFCETYVLDLDTRSWDRLDVPGLKPRYEHAAFAPPSKPGKIYVFGGANQAGNMNDMQVLDTEARTWATVNPSGTPPPAPRTHHTSAVVGDKLIIYSGGHTGADPVGDRQVHCFDASREAWSTVSVSGEPPKPRHGHVMAGVGQRVFLHGGMAGSTFYDDLHILDLDKKAWVGVKRKRNAPCGRAAHAMVVCGSDIFVFGGMNRDGALDDLHRLDTASLTWSRVEVQGPPPTCRLDLAACLVDLTLPRGAHAGTASWGQSGEPAADLSGTLDHARDVLERELKPGSASSRDSWSDVNASEAFFPIENHPDTSSGTLAEQQLREETVSRVKGEETPTQDGETGEPGDGGVQMDKVPVLLLSGGMDTEGEIFDDTLIFPIS